MPAAAKIGFLVRFLDDFQQLRMAVHALHIWVYIQRAEPPREILLLVRRQPVLAAQNDHLVIEKRLMDLIELGIRQAAEKVCPEDFGAESARQWLNGQGHALY